MRDYSSWIGKSEERRDVIAPWPAEALHAALERPGEPPRKADPLPPLWRWLYFLEARRRGELGRDGHPERGAGLIPPVEQPQRRWVGGRILFERPLKLGANATRLSTVAGLRRIPEREGTSALLTLRHETLTADGLIETEEQDIAFRRDPRPGEAPRAPLAARADESWRRVWTVDATLLFRFSALTFDSARIHYDLDYCREVEGFNGLVVQSSLLAVLMLELTRERGPDRRVRMFEFEAVSPVLHTEAFEVCGAPWEDEDGLGADLWIRAAGPGGGWGGRLAQTGRVRFV
ncbi:MAG: acyl-CoA dehydrogenase [Pseudomonadota bacterium]